jgi:hypothetical protein
VRCRWASWLASVFGTGLRHLATSKWGTIPEAIRRTDRPQKHSIARLSAFGSRVATLMLMLRHNATRASLSLGLRVARIRAWPPGALGRAGLSGAGSSRRNTHAKIGDSLRREAIAQRDPAQEGRNLTTGMPGVNTSSQGAVCEGDDRLESPNACHGNRDLALPGEVDGR